MRTQRYLAVMFLACAIPVLARDDPPAEEPAALLLSGVLVRVDAEDRSVTVEFGRDIDAMLAERRRERGGSDLLRRRGETPDGSPGSAGSLRVSVPDDAVLNLAFRDSPSVANSVRHTLEELKPHEGGPASIEITERDGRPVVKRVVAWR